MAMTQRQAMEILYQLDACYDMNFANDQTKYKLWLKKLMDKGDYDKSLAKTDKYIEENHFKPVIADVLAKPTNYFKDDGVDEQTKLHRWKMENDPQYRAEREKALQEMRRTLEKFDVKEDSDD